MAIYKALIWQNFETQFRKKPMKLSSKKTIEEYFMFIVSIELTQEKLSFKQVIGKA